MTGVIMAFQDYSFVRGILNSPWVGLRYFRTFFTSYDCGRLIRNTLSVGFIKCILEFPFPILLALMINEVRIQSVKKTTQTISYLPYFLSSVIVVTMLQRILAPDTGMLNQIKALFGGDSSTFYLMSDKYFYQILFTMDIWKFIGWSSIIYLAAISGVDAELYEAGKIDGCGKLRQIWHITLPGISGTIGILFIMNVGSLLSTGVEQIYLLHTPGNKAVSDTLDYFVLQVGIKNGQFGYATAMGLIQGAVGLFLVAVCNSLAKKFASISLW